MRLILFSFFFSVALSCFAQPNSGFLTFDGDSSEVVIQLQNPIGNSDKTIEFFFETCDNNESLNKIGLLVFPDEGITVSLTVNSAGNAGNLEVTKLTNPSTNDIYSANIYRHGSWNHLAMCYKSIDSTISLFFNGDKLGTSDSLKLNATNFILGGKVSNYFKGNMDNLRITDSCLYTGSYSVPSTLIAESKTDNLFSFNSALSNKTFISSGNNIDSAFAKKGAESVNEIFATVDTSICLGDSLKLLASGGSIFKWTSKNILTSDSTSSPIILGTISDTVNVKISNKNGCYINKSIDIQIEDPPVVDLGKDTSVCEGTAIQLNAGNHASYLWSNSKTDSSIFVTPGKIWVKVSAPKGCSNSDTINVIALPSPSIELGPDTLLQTGFTISIGVPAIFASYRWSTGETTPTIFATLPLIYAITVTDTNGCMATDQIEVTFPPLNISEIQSSTIGVYPNPTEGVLNIKNVVDQKLNISIINTLGETVFRDSYRPQTQDIEVPNFVNNGHYFLLIESEKISETLPFILER